MTRGLGAVGTMIADRIWHPSARGDPVEQLGGAAYSLAALSAACPDGWHVAPIVKVGADLWNEVHDWIGMLPGLDPEPGLKRVAEPNNRVELRYHDEANRCEMLTGGVPPWSVAEILPVAAPLDALYVNFISGMEMELATAAALRTSFRGPIYADLHSLFLGPPGARPRRPRALPRWEEWLGCFDAVQMNESELQLLGLDPGGITELLELGPSLVLVTRGAVGATYAARSDVYEGGAGSWIAGGATKQAAMPGDPHAGEVPTGIPPVAGDPTGCGDVWGATLFASLLEGSHLRPAIQRAHRAAAAKIRHPRTGDLHRALPSSNTRGGVLP